MASTTVTLSAISIPAEQRLYPVPTKIFYDTATATALDATLTPATGQAARIFKAVLSYSAAPAVGVFTIEDGSTVIFQANISASAPFVHQFDFGKAGLRGAVGAVLHAKVGSAGGAVVQTISCIGDIVMAS